MKERLQKLLCIKSIVTIVLTLVFAYLCITGEVNTDQFMTVFAVVIAFYFGTQAERKNSTSTISISEAANEVKK